MSRLSGRILPSVKVSPKSKSAITNLNFIYLANGSEYQSKCTKLQLIILKEKSKFDFYYIYNLRKWLEKAIQIDYHTHNSMIVPIVQYPMIWVRNRPAKQQAKQIEPIWKYNYYHNANRLFKHIFMQMNNSIAVATAANNKEYIPVAIATKLLCSCHRSTCSQMSLLK